MKTSLYSSKIVITRKFARRIYWNSAVYAVFFFLYITKSILRSKVYSK